MNIATFTNPKMINSGIRSTILTVITGAVIWLLNSHWITQNQVAGTSAVILGGIIWASTFIWGILEKRKPKLAAEVEAIAHRLGIDPEDLLGITPTEVANQVVAAAAKTVPPVTYATLATSSYPTVLIDGNAGQTTSGLVGTITGTAAAAADKIKPIAPALLVLGLLLPGLVGCQTLNTQAANITPAQVTTACTVIQQGTTDGVNILLAKYPQYKGDIVLVDAALNTYIASGKADPAGMQTALDSAIPAADQTQVQPAVDAFCLIYSAYVTPWLANQSASNVSLADAQQVLKAIDTGLNAALNPAPAATSAGGNVTVSIITPAS